MAHVVGHVDSPYLKDFDICSAMMMEILTKMYPLVDNPRSVVYFYDDSGIEHESHTVFDVVWLVTRFIIGTKCATLSSGQSGT